MQWYRADLHIHSVLSPCGDLDMSPARIIEEAKKKKLDIIGITDHNSTLHANVCIELGKKNGISVFPGVEINTQEEIHCLAFFENIEHTNKFQEFIDAHLPHIKNKPERFGMQLVVNENEEILEEVENLLIVGLSASIEETEHMTHNLGGIFIPAHVNRQVNGIYSQIGFLPDDLVIDAIELRSPVNLKEIYAKRSDLKLHQLITNSDAHNLHQIGETYTEYYLQEPTFKEWSQAIKGLNNRKIRINQSLEG